MEGDLELSDETIDDTQVQLKESELPDTKKKHKIKRSPIEIFLKTKLLQEKLGLKLIQIKTPELGVSLLNCLATVVV